MNESSSCSTSSPGFGIVSVSDFGRSNGYGDTLLVLICISLMTYDLRGRLNFKKTLSIPKNKIFYLPDTNVCVYMYIFKYLSKDILVTFTIQ